MADNSSGSGGVVNIKLKDIRITDRLGCGGFGEVKKGFYNGKTVAVKFLAPENRGITKRDKRDFQKEARRLNEASHHESILNIHGVVLDENTFALVLEYMHFGNVEHFIKDFDVGVPLRMRILKQIISAMDYLHSHNPPIKHLDLKAANVLIDCRFIAKVCDFGLSEFKTNTVTVELQGQNAKRRATHTHVAPEVLKDIRIKSSTAQDVYGFAITAWEIFTGEEVYKGKDVDTITQCVMRQQRPDLNCLVQECPDYVRNLIDICWDHQPGRRPTFRGIKDQFDKVYVRFNPQIRTSCLDIRRQICKKHAFNPEDYKEEFECTEVWDRPSAVEMLRDSEPDTSPTVQPQEDRSRLECEPTVQTQLSSSSDSSQATPDGTSERSLLNNVSGLQWQSFGSQNPSAYLVAPNLLGVLPSNNNNVLPTKIQQENDDVTLADDIQRLDVREMTEGETGQMDMNHHSQDGGNPHIDILVDRRTYTQETSSAYADRQIPEAGRGGSQGNPSEVTWVGNSPNNQEEDDMTMRKISQLRDRLSVLPPEPSEDQLLVMYNKFLSSQGTVLDTSSQPLETSIHQPLTLSSNANCRQEALNHDDRPMVPSNAGPSTPFVDALTGSHAGQAAGQNSQGHETLINEHGTMNEQSTNARTAQNLQTRETNMPVSGSANQNSPSYQPDTKPVQRNTTGFVNYAIGSANGQFLPPYARQQEIFGQPVQNQHVTPPTLFNQPVPNMGSGGYPQYTREILGQTNMQRPFYMPQQQALINPTSQAAPFQRPMYQSGSSQNQRQPLTSLPSYSGTGKLMSNLPEPPSNSTQFRPFSSTENSADELRTEIRPPQTSQPHASRGSSQERQISKGQNDGGSGSKATRETYQDAHTSGKPITINHKHEGGAFTQVFINSEMDLPPNIQIGNKNRMVVNDYREGKQHRKEKVAKRKSKCRLSQLSESRQGLSLAQVDLVSAESGQGWRKVCRQLGLDDPELEQLEYDYHLSGLYEIMYQGIRRWQQRLGQEATVAAMAKALWEADRDDLALQLPEVQES